MDFDDFLNDPISSINNLAQTSVIMPDLGINSYLSSLFQHEPSLLSKIPLILTNSDIQKAVPYSLVRIRCMYVASFEKEILFPKLPYKDRFLTQITDEVLPEDAIVPHPSYGVMRNQYLMSSINSLTKWVETFQYHPSSINPVSIHITTLSEEDKVPNLPFCIIAKTLFPIPTTPHIIYDLIGFLQEPDAFDEINSVYSWDDSSKSTYPTFICLNALRSDSLFTFFRDPSLSMKSLRITDKSQIFEAREVILSFLKNIFEPIQAEIFFLWFLGNVSNRIDSIPLGIFSLNFIGSTPTIVEIIGYILQEFCTSVSIIDANIPKIDDVLLSPVLKDNQLKNSPLAVPNGTRVLIDETKQREGQLKENGILNLIGLKQLISEQSLKWTNEITENEFDISMPVLVLSGGKSLLEKCDIIMPIGTVGSLDNIPELSNEMLMIVRSYVEEMPMRKIDFTPSMAETASNALEQVLGKFSINQKEARIFTELLRLTALSYGSDTEISIDVIQHTVSLFQSVLALNPYKM